jgi:hypothetical protein
MYAHSVQSTRSYGLTASELFAKSRRKIIQDIVKEQIRVIDAEINTSHTSGFNSIIHDLPANFNISGMDKFDAQTIVYSDILATYKNPEPMGKGFKSVYIERGEPAKLYISWVNGIDETERRQRVDFIKSCYLPENTTKK